MAFTAQTGDHKVTRSDVFLVDPRALVIDWRKNLSRGGIEPPVDEALIALARDMMPRKGSGDSPDGSSGQLNPILTRPLPDRRLEVVGGWRRTRAVLWLIESETCPDFKIKYTVSRMSDVEAAITNLMENIQREDPAPIQLAHAIRALTEDYGLGMEVVAGRLKKSVSWCRSRLDLVMLPAKVQASVASGNIPVAAALEIGKLPAGEQVSTFDALTASGGKVTAAKVREKRRQSAPASAAPGKPMRRTVKDLESFLADWMITEGPSATLAAHLIEYLHGTRSEDDMAMSWGNAFGLAEAPSEVDSPSKAPSPAAIAMVAETRRRKTVAVS